MPSSSSGSNVLKLVKLGKSLVNFVGKNKIVQKIINEIKEEYPDLSAMKRHPQFIELVCTMVETKSKNYKGKDKLDKKQLVISIITTMFPELNNNQDIEFINTIIDYACDSKNVESVSKLKQYTSSAGSWLKKKVL
jgi:hypothetical protein